MRLNPHFWNSPGMGLLQAGQETTKIKIPIEPEDQRQRGQAADKRWQPASDEVMAQISDPRSDATLG